MTQHATARVKRGQHKCGCAVCVSKLASKPKVPSKETTPWPRVAWLRSPKSSSSSLASTISMRLKPAWQAQLRMRQAGRAFQRKKWKPGDVGPSLRVIFWAWLKRQRKLLIREPPSAGLSQPLARASAASAAPQAPERQVPICGCPMIKSELNRIRNHNQKLGTPSSPRVFRPTTCNASPVLCPRLQLKSFVDVLHPRKSNPPI